MGIKQTTSTSYAIILSTSSSIDLITVTTSLLVFMRFNSTAAILNNIIQNISKRRHSYTIRTLLIISILKTMLLHLLNIALWPLLLQLLPCILFWLSVSALASPEKITLYIILKGTPSTLVLLATICCVLLPSSIIYEKCF